MYEYSSSFDRIYTKLATALKENTVVASLAVDLPPTESDGFNKIVDWVEESRRLKQLTIGIDWGRYVDDGSYVGGPPDYDCWVAYSDSANRLPGVASRVETLVLWDVDVSSLSESLSRLLVRGNVKELHISQLSTASFDEGLADKDQSELQLRDWLARTLAESTTLKLVNLHNVSSAIMRVVVLGLLETQSVTELFLDSWSSSCVALSHLLSRYSTISGLWLGYTQPLDSLSKEHPTCIPWISRRFPTSLGTEAALRGIGHTDTVRSLEQGHTACSTATFRTLRATQ